MQQDIYFQKQYNEGLSDDFISFTENLHLAKPCMNSELTLQSSQLILLSLLQMKNGGHRKFK